jgi:hypothetical protein
MRQKLIEAIYILITKPRFNWTIVFLYKKALKFMFFLNEQFIFVIDTIIFFNLAPLN